VNVKPIDPGQIGQLWQAVAKARKAEGDLIGYANAKASIRACAASREVRVRNNRRAA
jgi:hypothetical protein